MIIQIAGTSGSGKSHLMRAFIAWAEKEGFQPQTEYVTGRESPYSYNFPTKKKLGHNTVVMGAYETPTGGCDTIKDIAAVFTAVHNTHKQGAHVLFEGLFCMNQTRGPALAQEVGKDFCVLQLTTPLATCMASINARREARGEGELANKKNTIDNYKRAQNYCFRMRDSGASVYRVSRDEGLDKILDLLGVK